MNESADLLYVLIGTLIESGLFVNGFFDRAFDEIHRCNMRKFAHAADTGNLSESLWVGPSYVVRFG